LRVELAPADEVPEPATTFAVLRRLAVEATRARASGSIPFVLAGQCMSSLGTTAALDHDRLGVVWFDAHGDVNTPDTSPSGFLDGMAISALTGRAWVALAGGIDGFRPIPSENVVLVGARDLDPPEREAIPAWGLRHLRTEEIDAAGAGKALDAALAGLEARGVRRIYLHLDLDVLDTSVATINSYAAAGGLGLEQVEGVIREAGRRFEIAAAALTAYDPASDTSGRGERVALRLAETIARLWLR
jgi:arginase